MKLLTEVLNQEQYDRLRAAWGNRLLVVPTTCNAENSRNYAQITCASLRVLLGEAFEPFLTEFAGEIMYIPSLLPNPRGPGYGADVKTAILDLTGLGWSELRIAALLGCHRLTVRRVLEKS